MHRRTLAHLITLATVLFQPVINGELVVTPRHTEAKVGDITYFNCSTNLYSKEIFWHHGQSYIYTGSGILDPYRGRFEIDRNASKGSHNLVIHSVEPGDAGEYICIDDDGLGTEQSAELVVLDKEPDCQSNIPSDGVIGQNIFNIPPDEVQLICDVTYYGNIPPQMQWRKVGDNSIIKDYVTSNVTSNRLMSTLKLKGDISLDKSSYVCQTRRSTQSQYKCYSDTIKILYFMGGNIREQLVFKGNEIACITSYNTFPCFNQWDYYNNTFNGTITANLLGEYLCKVKCHVRGRDLNFEALKVTVVETPIPPAPSSLGKLAALGALPIIIMLIVLIVRHQKHRKRTENPVNIQDEFGKTIKLLADLLVQFGGETKNLQKSGLDHDKLEQLRQWLAENAEKSEQLKQRLAKIDIANEEDATKSLLKNYSCNALRKLEKDEESLDNNKRYSEPDLDIATK